jgi:hypothetical protein
MHCDSIYFCCNIAHATQKIVRFFQKVVHLFSNSNVYAPSVETVNDTQFEQCTRGRTSTFLMLEVKFI